MWIPTFFIVWSNEYGLKCLNSGVIGQNEIGKMRQCFIRAIASMFIVVAVISIIVGIIGCLPCPIDYIAAASALGTLAGAILVFSTLEMQRKSLNEEKHKNEIEKFNSRFHPILSSFRTDASNMEIAGDYISSRGIGTTAAYKGEKAFKAATSIVKGLKKCLGDASFTGFDKEEFEATLNNYSEILDSMEESFSSPDDIDRIEEEQKEYIKSNQVLFLIDKWGITKGNQEKYQQMDSKAREAFLLNTLFDHQSATISKYIQSLRFILQIINAIKSETERNEYYQHVSCLIGKEELAFLKCFSEFNIITATNYV